MYKIRFHIHFENKTTSVTDWDREITTKDLNKYRQICRDIKQLQGFATYIDGLETYVHPNKLTHLQIEIQDDDEDLEEEDVEE